MTNRGGAKQHAYVGMEAVRRPKSSMAKKRNKTNARAKREDLRAKGLNC